MDASEVFLLPAQPRVLVLLMRELHSKAFNMQRINQLFSSDPVLAGALMAEANRKEYPLSGRVRCVSQAILALPRDALLQMMQRAVTCVVTRSSSQFDMVAFANISYACARLARSLAGLVGLDRSAAYTAALLHGMGQAVLHHTKSQRIYDLPVNVDVWDPRRPRLELRYWGYSANSTTAALLRQWRWPRDLIAATQAMEAPMQADPFDPMAGVLHLAAWCSRTKHCGWSERMVVDAFPVGVAMALGLDVDVVLQQEAIDWTQSLY